MAIGEHAVLVLHHGTTMQAASSITREGWKPTNVMDIVARVATAHGLCAADVIHDLETHDRGRSAATFPLPLDPCSSSCRLVGEPAYRSQAMAAPSRSGRYPGLPAIYRCRAAAFAALQLA